MASPYVAGVAALAFAANPSLSPADVKSVLYSTAADMAEPGFDAQTGFGMADAAAAVQMAKAGPTLRGGSSVAVGRTTRLAIAGGGGGSSSSGGYGSRISWASSDPNVATVVNTGAVTGVSPGYAVITAQCESDDGAVALKTAVSVHDPGIDGTTT